MLKKTKIFFLIASGVIVLIIIVILLTRFIVPDTKIRTTPVLPGNNTQTVSILNNSEVTVATKAKTILLPQLPIDITNFENTNGIKTDIHISSFKNDNPEDVRIEIFGIDYNYNQNDPNTNPNMVAFKDSFVKAIDTIKADGVNINDLHILLSNKQYIRDVAETWIKTLNLLP